MQVCHGLVPSLGNLPEALLVSTSTVLFGVFLMFIPPSTQQILNEEPSKHQALSWMLKTWNLNKNISSYPRICSPVGETDAETDDKMALQHRRGWNTRADVQSVLLGSRRDPEVPLRSHSAISGLCMWKIRAHWVGQSWERLLWSITISMLESWFVPK